MTYDFFPESEEQPRSEEAPFEVSEEMVEEPVTEEAAEPQSRTFLYAVMGLVTLLLLSLGLLCFVAWQMRERFAGPSPQALTQQAQSLAATQTAVAQATLDAQQLQIQQQREYAKQTQAALTAQARVAAQNFTATPTSTWTPTVTPTLADLALRELPTATRDPAIVAAEATLLAAGTPAVLPQTGLGDGLGMLALAMMGLLLVGVILFVRKLRMSAS